MVDVTVHYHYFLPRTALGMDTQMLKTHGLALHYWLGKLINSGSMKATMLLWTSVSLPLLCQHLVFSARHSFDSSPCLLLPKLHRLLNTARISTSASSARMSSLAWKRNTCLPCCPHWRRQREGNDYALRGDSATPTCTSPPQGACMHNIFFPSLMLVLSLDIHFGPASATRLELLQRLLASVFAIECPTPSHCLFPLVVYCLWCLCLLVVLVLLVLSVHLTPLNKVWVRDLHL